MANGEFEPVWKKFGDSNFEMAFTKFISDKMSIGNSMAEFTFKEPGAVPPKEVEILNAEIMIKPLINVVWAGVIIVVIGFILAIPKRLNKSKVDLTPVETETEESVQLPENQ